VPLLPLHIFLALELVLIPGQNFFVVLLHVRLPYFTLGYLLVFLSLPNIVRVVKSRRMRWAGHVARMGKGRGVHRVLVGKPEGKRPLGRPRRRWEDNIKMDLQVVGGCLKTPTNNLPPTVSSHSICVPTGHQELSYRVTVPYAALVQLYPPEDEHLRLETCRGEYYFMNT